MFPCHQLQTSHGRNRRIDLKNLEGLGLRATHQLVVYAEDINFYNENIKTKRKAEKKNWTWLAGWSD